MRNKTFILHLNKKQNPSFRSEIKALLLYEKIKPKLSLEGLHYYLNLRFLPGEVTMFKGIKKLLPGHYLLYKLSSKNMEVSKYWEVKVSPEEHTESFFVKKLREILKESVKRHLISDVPVGIYLSGGIDSSSIVAFASQVSEEPVKTFTMGFNEPSDELRDAKQVSEFFETEHYELVIDSDLMKDYPAMIWYADTPKRNLYPYYIAKVVRKHVKVVLGGLGGDELFAGYEWKYQFAEDTTEERSKIPNNLKFSLRKEIPEFIKYVTRYGSLHEIDLIHNLRRAAYIDNDVKQYLLIMSLDEVYENNYLKEKIYGEEIQKIKLPQLEDIFKPFFEDNNLNLIDKILLADFKIKMVDDFLFVEDSMSSANSLESRVPFLDKELVEFVFTIPSRFKYREGRGKYIFKKAMQGILPKEVIKKEKQGFSSDVVIRFEREIREIAKQILMNGYLVKDNLIKGGYIENILNYRTSRSLTKHYITVWNLLTLEIWYRMYIKQGKIPKPLTLNKLEAI